MKNLIKKITRTLATASHLIIASPVRLPPKVVAVAKYVSLGVALLETIDLDDGGDATPHVSPHADAEADGSGRGKEDPSDGH